MAKLHKEIKTNFTQIPNKLIKNGNLSAKSKGIYSYLASKPDGWDYKVWEIVKHFKEGETAIRAGIRELETNGYLTKKPKRVKESGKFDGWDWIIYGEPNFTENGKNRNSDMLNDISNTESSNTISETNTNSDSEKNTCAKTKSLVKKKSLPTKDEAKKYFIDYATKYHKENNPAKYTIDTEKLQLKFTEFWEYWQEREWAGVKNWKLRAGTWVRKMFSSNPNCLKPYKQQNRNTKFVEFKF